MANIQLNTKQFVLDIVYLTKTIILFYKDCMKQVVCFCSIPSASCCFLLSCALVVGKCLRDEPTCWLHTPAVSKCLRDEPKLWSHTPAVGKCVRDTPTRWSHTPAVGKCVRDKPTGWSHTPAVGKCVRSRDKPTRWSHTPAVGKFLRDNPTYSPGNPQLPLEAFGTLLGPLV